jgi:hypothetical protein
MASVLAPPLAPTTINLADGTYWPNRSWAAFCSIHVPMSLGMLS